MGQIIPYNDLKSQNHHVLLRTQVVLIPFILVVYLAGMGAHRNFIRGGGGKPKVGPPKGEKGSHRNRRKKGPHTGKACPSHGENKYLFLFLKGGAPMFTPTRLRVHMSTDYIEF